MYKFKKGDKVQVKKSTLSRTGTVVDRYLSRTGLVEYAIDFGDWSFEYFYESDLDHHGANRTGKCECGAVKVYGAKTMRLHHAFWCPARGNVDDEK